MRKIFFLIIFFYILVLFQTSFLIYFPFGWQFDWIIILISIIFINLLERPKNYLGYLSAIIGGFFLDIFSKNFIGFHILILMSFTIFIKFILKKYISLPIWRNILETKK
ncbi:MAG: hypothetical protein QME61_02610 [Patescibacteria group bacterium]|nr:hypothetical protein [Patescibacteria group bacterium]